MASYHFQINTGDKATGSALEHSQYIQREGPFTEERYGEVAARGRANFPEWAREDPSAFWKASDEYERANGNTYREYELALPRELSRSAQVALVERFAQQELGAKRPYQWAIHLATASDGKEQPHVHLMFSDRQQDGIERGPEQFFKRYNAKNPERGGARKFSYGADKEEAARTYEGIRERWATVQNQALEQAGVEARVDHRSLAAQGIHREPEVHRGPAVSGIEARGERSQVGERQREQRLARTQARAMVVAEVRVVTRAEVAAERVAVRERRELAREAQGADRALVLPLVEADRREQLGRAQAAAERRVERRQGLGIGGQLKEKLLTQARALRERIGQQLGRVKEWVRERFPDPLKQIKERSREVFEAVVEKTQRAMGRPELQREAGVRTGAQAQPEPPALSPQMSLAERLELLSNAVAERLDREAHPQGIEEDAFRRQRGHDAPGRQSLSADHPTEPGGRRATVGAGEEGGGEVAPQRLQPSDGANELTLAEQLHARADEVARRVEQELAQDGAAARAQRADVERQRVHEETEEKQRGRGRSRGRSLGDDDDEFTRGRGR